MAVRTALTSRLRTVSSIDDSSKLDLSLTENYDKPHMVESLSGWCGGDFTGDVQETSDAVNLREEIKFKDTLIDELQKSNHELRMKFAEAENKIAKMRVKIDSHCECCARSMGEDVAERKRYASNDWSSTRSFGLDFTYMSPPAWNKEVVKITEDNTNPYVKVRRWQDTFAGEVMRETESTCSSYILKRSPNCVTLRTDNTRPESPATSGLAGDYILVPLGDSAPSSGFRGFDNEDSRPGSPQKLSLFRRDQQPIGYAIEEENLSSHLPTVKSSPDERILSSRQQHLNSDSSAPSATIRTLRSPRDYEKLESQAIDHYRQATMRTMQNSWVQHENHPRLSIWNRPNDSGIVGKLMRDPNRK